ncbi:TRAP transporter small permease [Amorphus coralli]|uniref:TRAP transporter small permease n=1 Tax=Amorphus coralli TaxID=340680 RepID=UPI000362363B|nr:TRAP transporter small permease [Amorphus coralli]
MLGRAIDTVERISAAFLAVVTALVFVSVILRYIFAWGLPDANDVTENLLGIVIFWGIAIASYRDEHITVDLLWTPLSARGKRIVDVFATIFAAVCLAYFCWAMLEKVSDTRDAGVTTIDLGFPIWPYHLVAWTGILAATCLTVLKIADVVRAPAAE